MIQGGTKVPILETLTLPSIGYTQSVLCFLKQFPLEVLLKPEASR